VFLLPTNFKHTSKQPLEDQQTVLYFCGDGHFYPFPERSDLFAGYLLCYCKQQVSARKQAVHS